MIQVKGLIARIEEGAAQEREERRSLYAAVSELRARIDSLDARVSDVEGRLDER